LALAACGDSLSLRVVVHHPAEATVAKTVVSIYESSSATCKQIELGDLSTAQLAAILVTEQTVGDESGDLDGIARVDRKLVVARGFDEMGRLLTAGCTEKEEITGQDVVQVDTDFAVTLSIGAVAAGELGIPITLTDAEGRSRDGHRVSWRVYGPHAAMPSTSSAALAPGDDASWELAQPACTNASGVARLHPVPPAKVGGYAIELRPSWPAKPNTLLTSFTKIDPTQSVIEPGLNVTRPCAIRVAGTTRRLVCLQAAMVGGTTVAREYDVAVTNGNARLQLRGTPQPAAGAIALFSIPHGANRDVYAVTSNGQLIGMFSPSMPPSSTPALPAGTVATDAVLLPACDPAAGQLPQLLLRVASATGKRVQMMTPLGGPLSDYHGVSTDPLLTLTLRGTGCVTELKPSGGEPKRRQAAIVDVSRRVMPSEQRTTSSIVFECDLPDSSKCTAVLPVPGVGAGLSAAPVPGGPPPAPTEEPQLVGMFFDATGVVMSSWVLLPNSNGEFLLVERGRVPAAAIPNRVVTGDFDGDGKADLFWDLPSLTQPTSNFQATYGRAIGELRLSALSGAEPLLVDDMLAGDLTGDTFDDLVIYGRKRSEDDLGNITVTSGIVVVPMNVAAPNPDPMFDKPCQ
jgi:hypothetical protein